MAPANGDYKILSRCGGVLDEESAPGVGENRLCSVMNQSHPKRLTSPRAQHLTTSGSRYPAAYQAQLSVANFQVMGTVPAVFDCSYRQQPQYLPRAGVFCQALLGQ